MCDPFQRPRPWRTPRITCGWTTCSTWRRMSWSTPPPDFSPSTPSPSGGALDGLARAPAAIRVVRILGHYSANLSPLHALAQRRGARRPGPRAGCDSSCAYFRALQRRSSCDMDLPPQQVGPEPPPKRPCTAGAGVQGMQLALLQPAAPTSSVQFSTIAELLEHEDVYCEACAHQPPHPAPPPPPPPCRTSRATAADSWGERSSTKLTVPARARRRTSQVRRRHP